MARVIFKLVIAVTVAAGVVATAAVVVVVVVVVVAMITCLYSVLIWELDIHMSMLRAIPEENWQEYTHIKELLLVV